MAEERWKDHCLLSHFSPSKAALGAPNMPSLNWWAAATCLFCSLLHPTLTLLSWLQASQECKSESGQAKNEDQTKPKAVSKQVSGTNGQLRAQLVFLLLMPVRRMWNAARSSERETMSLSTLILLMNVETAAAAGITKPSEFSCAGRRQRMRLSAAYVG